MPPLAFLYRQLVSRAWRSPMQRATRERTQAISADAGEVTRARQDDNDDATDGSAAP